MGRRLYVGNLSYNTTELELREVFGTIGTVAEAKVVTERETGRPRGFAFVEMINIHEREEPFRGAGFRETTAAANPISEQPTLECCTVHVEADR